MAGPVNSGVRTQGEFSLDTKEKVITAAKIYLNPYGFLLGKIVDEMSDSINQTSDATKLELADLRVLAEKQALQMQMAESQARVAQELAIAKRIELAVEVEIEEFYDLHGEGSVGVKADEKAVSLGASASAQKVCKRIYKFRGGNITAEPES